MIERLFSIGRSFSREDEQRKHSAALQAEAENYELASDGGYWTFLKIALFILFAYYNARLFLVTVPGWEKWHTALFALLAEATAFWCLHNYTRSSGSNKVALATFGVLLTLFSFTHAAISFFGMETDQRFSGGVRYYAEHVAFPLLFGLLLLASIIIPLTHWRKRIAQEQAKSQIAIATKRARLASESASMKDENAMERERLDYVGERIKIANEYTKKLESLADALNLQTTALERIKNPKMRKEVAIALGLDSNERSQAHLNGHAEWFDDDPKKERLAQ